jgi:hypothetical protein
MTKHGTRPDEKQQHCSYYDALAAIGLMKGLNMIDVARDDALIGTLMDMDLSAVRRIVEHYSRNELGYPTVEKIAALAAGRGLPPLQQGHEPEYAPEPEPACEPQSEPQPVVPVQTVRDRLLDLAWGVIGGIATTLVLGWMPLPWLQRLAAWLLGLPANLLDLLLGPGSLAFAPGTVALVAG